jgi:hypothetical protein
MRESSAHKRRQVASRSAVFALDDANQSVMRANQSRTDLIRRPGFEAPKKPKLGFLGCFSINH